MIERYVTATELAELMGVSLSTIKRWTAAKMPSETWGMGHTRRYQPSRCIAWATDQRPGGRASGPGRGPRWAPDGPSDGPRGPRTGPDGPGPSGRARPVELGASGRGSVKAPDPDQSQTKG